MAIPNTRDELIDYCLRSLGSPVVEINVADEQIEDRIDEALQYFREMHPDGSKRFYISHELTQTDIDNKYVTLNEDIHSVVRAIPLTSGSVQGWFSDAWQFMKFTITDFVSGNGTLGDLAYYEGMKQHLELLDMKLNGHPILEFDRQEMRVRFHRSDLKVGDYIVLEVFGIRDPDTGAVSDYNSLYNHKFVKDYATALIKKQWGVNMSKFEGMLLPGGVQISGRQILEDANIDIERIMTRFREEEDIGPIFFVG